MVRSELHIHDNTSFASDKLHVHFAVALLFFLIGTPFFLHIWNPFVILRKRVLKEVQKTD